MIRNLFTSFLFIFCSICAKAQLRPYSLSLWQDSFNVRIHIDEHLLNNMLHESYAERVDTFISTLQLFQYSAINGKGPTTVSVKHFVGDSHAILLEEKGVNSLINYLEGRIPKSVQLRHIILHYNNEGLLQYKFAIHKFKGTGKVVYDSTWYSYRGRNNELIVNTRIHKIKFTPRAYYSSLYCGEIFDKPLTIKDSGHIIYSFNQDGRLLKRDNLITSSANDCIYNDSAGWYTEHYSYDKKGRLIAIKSTAYNGERADVLRTYTYIDSNKVPIPLLATPLMEQYISTIDSPYFSKVIYRSQVWRRHYKDQFLPEYSPEVATDSQMSIRDAQHKLKLLLPLANYQYQLPTLYMHGFDTLGHYRMATEVWTGTYDTVDAVYNPALPRRLVTERHGCIVEIFNELPKGTWQFRQLYCSDRVVVNDKSGWKIVAYPPYGNISISGLYDFIAPMHNTRYCISTDKLQNFIIVDADDKVRYVYERGNIFILQYE